MRVAQTDGGRRGGCVDADSDPHALWDSQQPRFDRDAAVFAVTRPAGSGGTI